MGLTPSLICQPRLRAALREQESSIQRRIANAPRIAATRKEKPQNYCIERLFARRQYAKKMPAIRERLRDSLELLKILERTGSRFARETAERAL